MTKNLYVFYVDIPLCNGCRSCEIACKEENQLDDSIRWRQVRKVNGVVENHPTMYFMSMACNHRENPICVNVCPQRP